MIWNGSDDLAGLLSNRVDTYYTRKALKMINTPAYSELYLQDAMTNLGEFAEYAALAAPELSLDDIFRMFIISGYSSRFEKGDPQVISGLSGTELFLRTVDICGYSKEKWPEPICSYETGETYWCGYILAFYQWKKAKSFSTIISKVPVEYLLKTYPALHTVSEEKAYEVIEAAFSKNNTASSRLQEYRKRLGLSQKQLADASGVNVRTLQQYEIGTKDLSKASLDKTIALSRVLNCKPDDIID
jgi:DNA-binding XRE family transcriptional regulator